MEKKEFTHNKIEICKLSQKEINTLRENYVIMLDCQGDKILKIGFYKGDLLKNLIKEKGEKVMKALMEKTQSFTNNMLQKIGLIKPVYQIQNN